MKKTRFQQMKEEVASRFELDRGRRIAEGMEREYRALCDRGGDWPADMDHHAHNNIFPALAAVLALQAEGMERQEAVELASDCFLTLMEKIAGSIRNMLKVPGLYRLMPWLWKTLMPKLFSPEAGFRFEYHPTDRREVRFDMTACPYYQICQKLDCLDLAPLFCATDDTCYGNMHPKLLWHRTKTIARGADLCDFDLKVKK